MRNVANAPESFSLRVGRRVADRRMTVCRRWADNVPVRSAANGLTPALTFSR